MSEQAIIVFLILVFLAVFLLAQGLVVPVFGENRQARKRLKQRLGEFDTVSQDAGINSILREKFLRKLSPWERRLESLPFVEGLSHTIEQSGNKYLGYRVLLLSVAIAVAAAFFAWVTTRMPLAAIAAFVVCAAVPYLKIVRDRGTRFAKIEEQLPDAIDIMRRALLAGHPFSAALKLVAEDMDDPIAHEFELTFADMNYGSDVRRAMLGLLARIPCVTVMALVTTVLVQKETGGNLAGILEQIAKVVRSRFRFFRRVMTLSAEGRMSAWVLVLVPLLLFVAMMVINPDYLPLLLNDPLGEKIITVTVIWAAIGIYFLRRIIRIEV